MSTGQRWPRYAEPADLARIETTALSDRGIPTTTYELLREAADQWDARTAITVLPDGERWAEPTSRTYRQMHGDVVAAANLLHSLGTRRTTAVAVLAPNCDELITATLASELAGIAAPINPALSGEHIGELLRRSGASTLIAAGPELDPDIWRTAGEAARAAGVSAVLLLRPTAATAPPGRPPVLDGVEVRFLAEAAREHRNDVFAGVPPAAGDIAALFHTGGTTGMPKLAAHTHGNEVADAWMVAANNALDDDSVILGALPLFHVNALIVTLLAPLLRGQEVVWAGPLGYRDPALIGNFWKILSRYRVTTMSAVPTVYAILSQIPIDADITAMRHAIVGASPLPQSVRQAFMSHTGIPLLEGYGLTEATCATARSFPDHPRPGSVGQRMPYQSVKAVHIDDNGVWHDVPAGSEGILAISGPTVFPGYVTEVCDGGVTLDGMGKLVDGWLDTGDLGRVDAEGFIYLTGRAKDLIIRGGHNIDPGVVEDALLAHPDVTAAAAVGRPDVRSGEVPVAYVTLRPGATTTAEELLAWAGQHVGEPAARPKSVTVLDSLPVTAVGKPYKVPLRSDATRSAVREALDGLPGVTDIEIDGDTAVTVSVDQQADRTAVADILSRFAFTWRLV